MTQDVEGPRRTFVGEGAPNVHLPPRYSAGWYDLFEAQFWPALKRGVRILDVGSGRQPALLPTRRPPACTYVGLDVSGVELEQAPSGSYDEIVEGDITVLDRSLENRFDLLISWQLLEHVRPLALATENMRLYLRSGGTMVSLLSGGRSLFGLVNRLIPHPVARRSMHLLLGRDPASVFPAYYDHCHYSALCTALAEWSLAEVEPLYRGASYVRFSAALQRVYLLGENWLERAGHLDYATHYLITATR